MKRTHRSIFLKEVKEAFPELREAINDQYGLLHLEMHEFRDFVQKQFELGNRLGVAKAFKIVERHYQEGNDDLIEAISASFLEHLDFVQAKGERSWAYELLPNGLRQPYEQLRTYHGI